MKKFIIPVLIISLTGCSPLSRMKKYEGQPIQSVLTVLGKPTLISESEGDTIYIFESSKTLPRAEINKGQTTLDPMLTPTVIKTEKAVFKVVGGKVSEVKKETEYTRR